MSKNDKKSIDLFFSILRAGLWEQDVFVMPFGDIDVSSLKQMAREQSVVGLIAAGLEHVVDKRLAKPDVLHFVGQALQLEQQNTAMNYFIRVLVEKMRKEGIYTLLVKGQGIAQCYERPLWRSCGDVDFFLSEDNYKKAKDFLIPLATSVENEYIREKHLGMTIDPWVVELHGSLYSGLSSRIEKGLDEIRDDTFIRGNARSWMNGDTQVFLLSPDNDAVYVFTHILQHFFKGGIGVRQICDWARLLWTYRDDIDCKLLRCHLKSMGLMTEWKAFMAFAVGYLGMPSDAMLLYSPDKKWKRKAGMISSFIIEVGNFGHNRDKSYIGKYPYLIRKVISFGRRVGDLYRHARIFPLDSVRFLPRIVINGLCSAIRGE